MNIDYKKPITVRTAAAVTTSYVAGTVIGAETTDKTMTNEYNQLILNIAITKASLTSIELKVEFSPDNTTWYRESHEKLDNGTGTIYPLEYSITASSLGTTENVRLPIQINDRYVRVSVKGTGTVTSSSVGITATLGVN